MDSQSQEFNSPELSTMTSGNSRILCVLIVQNLKTSDNLTVFYRPGAFCLELLGRLSFKVDEHLSLNRTLLS